MRLLGDPYVEYDGRKSMRSLADALTKLREEHHLDEGQNVTIKTMGVMLPDGPSSGFVSVLGPQQPDGTRMIIFMPSSARFSGRTTLGDCHTYMISELNDATSDSDGNVELVDGRFLHAIELIPAPAHYDFSLTDHKIVHSALAYMELGHQCYRALDKELLPGLKVLDYAEVAKVRNQEAQTGRAARHKLASGYVRHTNNCDTQTRGNAAPAVTATRFRRGSAIT